MKHARSRAREAALKVLYQADVLARDLTEDAIEKALTGERLRPGSLAYARSLIRGCLTQQEKLDGAIGRALKNWELTRLAAVDRCVLRIGTYELIFSEDVPAKVTINEAIELAKKYSTEESGSFINGILDQVHRSLRRDA